MVENCHKWISDEWVGVQHLKKTHVLPHLEARQVRLPILSQITVDDSARYFDYQPTSEVQLSASPQMLNWLCLWLPSGHVWWPFLRPNSFCAACFLKLPVRNGHFEHPLLSTLCLSVPKYVLSDPWSLQHWSNRAHWIKVYLQIPLLHPSTELCHISTSPKHQGVMTVSTTQRCLYMLHATHRQHGSTRINKNHVSTPGCNATVVTGSPLLAHPRVISTSCASSRRMCKRVISSKTAMKPGGTAATIHVGIKLPFADGLYTQFLVILGIAYSSVSHITMDS